MKKIVKNIIYTSVLGGFLIILLACEEEKNAPLVTDGEAPGKVTEVSAMSIPGGARIEYTLPDAEDVQLVRAEYELDNGSKRIARSSVFNNFIEVKGYLDSLNDKRVSLIVEDKGGNESEAVAIDIRPAAAPVFTTAQTVRAVPDFGGIRVFWSNPSEELVTLTLNTPGNLGETTTLFVQAKTTAEEEFRIVRGFKNELTTFEAFVFDQYNNTSEVIDLSLIPLREELVPKEGMIDLVLPGDIPENGNQRNKPRLWDGELGGFTDWITLDNGGSGRVADPVDEYDPALGNPESHLVTIDLGRSVNISRFVYHVALRGGTAGFYDFGTWRRFDLWATNEEPNPDGSLDGWTKIFDNAEIVKPSGLPRGQLSQDDINAASQGHEFVFPLVEGGVQYRYIRFALLENWLGSIVFTANEIEFFGEFDE